MSSQGTHRSGIGTGAWIAIIVGVLVVGLMLLGCLGMLFFAGRAQVEPFVEQAPAAAPAAPAPPAGR